MIRIRAGERKERFHRVKPAHAAVLNLAAFGKTRDVIMSVIFATEENRSRATE